MRMWKWDASWYLQNIFWICFHFLDRGAWHYLCQLLSSPGHLLKSNDSMCTCLAQPYWVWFHAEWEHSVSQQTLKMLEGFQLIIYNCCWLSAIGTYKTGHIARTNLKKNVPENLCIKIQCSPTLAWAQPRIYLSFIKRGSCFPFCIIGCPPHTHTLSFVNSNTRWGITCNLLLQTHEMSYKITWWGWKIRWHG